jgi:hexosaminidase
VSILNPQDIETQVVQRYDATTDQLSSSLIISVQGASVLEQEGWRLYFSLGLTLAAGETRARTQIVDGRFGYLEPTMEWPVLSDTRQVRLDLAPWMFAGMKLGARQGFYLTRTGLDDKEELLGSPRILEPLVDELPRLENSWIRDTSPGCDISPQTPKHLYEKNLLVLEQSVGFTIIPAVKDSLFEQERLDLTTGFKVDYDTALADEGAHLEDLLNAFCTQSATGTSVKLSLAMDLKPESYRLTANKDGISIIGADPAGVFYGIQSLRQLLADGKLPYVAVEDTPDWPHRALFLDIARHFQNVEQIIKTIRMMASYKMNVLQLGISNDEGWRLEIPSVPELTSIGSRRQHQVLDASGHIQALYPAWGDDHELYAGYLSQNDMVRILETAASHHIEVILELNLPGHANAIIMSLEDSEHFQVVDPLDKSVHRSAQGFCHNVVNVSMDSTYQFVKTVLNDIKHIYTQADVELKTIHFGGDETPDGAWLGSPLVHECDDVWNPEWSMENEQNVKAARHALMAHHYQQITAMAEKVIPGINIGFWHEMAPYANDSHSNSRRYFNAWTTEKGQRAVLQNMLSNSQEMVICNASYLYLDMPYGMHMDEPGLPWASYIDTQLIYHFDPLDCWNIDKDSLHLVKGLQAQLWGETVYDSDLADYYLFPRLLAVAERAWNSKPQPSRWGTFTNAVGKRELKYLEEHKVQFRVPPPGAKYEDGILSANSLFPDLTISFTIDGSEPQMDSRIYREPVALALHDDGEIKLRAFTAGGRGSRTVVINGTD